MRSRAEAPPERLPAGVVRPRAEWLLRGLALLLLVWSLVQVVRSRGRGGIETSRSAELRSALARWSTVASPAQVHVRLDHPPPGVERDWLAALPGAGTSVAWSGPSLLPTAITTDPIADPAGGITVSVAAPPEARVVLRDTLGPLDSAQAGAAGVRFDVPKPRNTVDAVVGAVTARDAVHDSLGLHRLLVIGRAEWETKFAIAALEERGWTVDAHIVVSPKSDVRQGRITDIDTANYSAVLAIDTTAARYAPAIARYVREGGGLVLWAPAAKAPVLAALAPGLPGTLIPDDGRIPVDSVPREALELTPITSLKPDAIVLERRGDDVALAARRVGPGRVVETGYVNSWRWRMAGGETAPEAHRTWLARLVASVAYATRHAVAAAPTDVAPLATLVDRLGPATSGAITRRDARATERLLRWVFGIVCGALLLEWASRRLRGVK